MKILAPSEAACVYCRLGWLNVYNPCKPEGAWELDMARREERVVAKTLCVLATNEPGDNWVYETFRWMRSMESMPGWELVRIPVDSIIFISTPPCNLSFYALQTQPWLTEEGMPMRGLVNITYYSGEGVRKKGCRPYVNFRKALLNLVRVKLLVVATSVLVYVQGNHFSAFFTCHALLSTYGTRSGSAERGGDCQRGHAIQAAARREARGPRLPEAHQYALSP